MSTLAYLATAKTVDDEGVFGPTVVIDGIGNFPVAQLEAVVSALIELRGELDEQQKLTAV
jgi:hypothetical protein